MLLRVTIALITPCCWLTIRSATGICNGMTGFCACQRGWWGEACANQVQLEARPLNNECARYWLHALVVCTCLTTHCCLHTLHNTLLAHFGGVQEGNCPNDCSNSAKLQVTVHPRSAPTLFTLHFALSTISSPQFSAPFTHCWQQRGTCDTANRRCNCLPVTAQDTCCYDDTIWRAGLYRRGLQS